MPKQPVISFRVDPDTYALAEKMAAARSESVGGFAKEQLLEGMGEITEKNLEVELVFEEIRTLKAQASKGFELLARLMCRGQSE